MPCSACARQQLLPRACTPLQVCAEGQSCIRGVHSAGESQPPASAPPPLPSREFAPVAGTGAACCTRQGTLHPSQLNQSLADMLAGLQVGGEATGQSLFCRAGARKGRAAFPLRRRRRPPHPPTGTPRSRTTGRRATPGVPPSAPRRSGAASTPHGRPCPGSSRRSLASLGRSRVQTRSSHRRYSPRQPPKSQQRAPPRPPGGPSAAGGQVGKRHGARARTRRRDGSCRPNHALEERIPACLAAARRGGRARHGWPAAPSRMTEASS